METSDSKEKLTEIIVSISGTRPSAHEGHEGLRKGGEVRRPQSPEKSPRHDVTWCDTRHRKRHENVKSVDSATQSATQARQLGSRRRQRFVEGACG